MFAEALEHYQVTILILGATAAMIFLQLVIADIVGIRSGHTPGSAIERGHESFLFRSARVVANSNEGVAIFILAVLFAILSAADPSWVNAGAVIYFVGRLAHMLCYYANQKLLRSIAFAVSMLGLLIIIVVGFLA